VEIANNDPIGNKHQTTSKTRYSEMSETVKKANLSLLYHKFKPMTSSPDVLVSIRFNLVKIKLLITLSSQMKLKAKKYSKTIFTLIIYKLELKCVKFQLNK